eukprot:Protomagalhaensia_wolfi_Nauph_80__5193@NODE_556_length_2294_cov_215_958758_g401_i1_p3_GENE_NODE_556_length_2294_cov_215_958758_g401_i1NODE_556_length_2294_cov_215_958758_g401_i1_p3_ORF_typecomplete_len187_score41_16EFhand_7/PF13499_6/2_1e15EFhand_7/PF13499_6/3_6e14EFhand_8/PF13833_6/0_001EFhand_8/PF13833_6/8_1e09EFhand_8/PF13833_6/0_06EFhand_8/PF13833_6/2_5e11EFhand_11/PF08976_11/4_6e13EFhand_11/PF08976_11/1_4e08EFhand_6/PF13405_6/1_3e09EFhand_6/PF13405_6/1_2EFhand_6/PF13405_6/0_00045EFhand_6/PF
MHNKGFQPGGHRNEGRNFGGAPGGAVVSRRRGSNVRTSLTDEQKQEIKEAFDLFDEHKTGKIDYHELKTILKALGFEVTKQQVLELMKQYDASNTGYILYNDFVLLMTDKMLSRDPMEEIALAFKLFDDDNTGTITLKNLRRVACELGEDLTDDELKAMIDEFDKDMDGAIDEKDFASIMQQAAMF